VLAVPTADSSFAAALPEARGSVKDRSGAVVERAQVVLHSAGQGKASS